MQAVGLDMGQFVDEQVKFRCQTFSEEGSNEQFVFTSFSGNPRAQSDEARVPMVID